MAARVRIPLISLRQLTNLLIDRRPKSPDYHRVDRTTRESATPRTDRNRLERRQPL